MKIKLIEIQNFRKLKSCRIELDGKQTVFVGANNSGKTTAMDAIRLFLKKDERKKISTIDFTIINWKKINEIGIQWIGLSEDKMPDLTLASWRPLIPTVDVWLSVEATELHYVSHLIPTLDWEVGDLGVRLSLEPKNLEKLYKDFTEEYNLSKKVIEESDNTNKSKLKLWPKNLKDFLDIKIENYFSVKSYILDQKNIVTSLTDKIKPQDLPDNINPIECEPFDGLFKIDFINAQRGFTDANANDSLSGNSNRGLSSQLISYFKKHLNPSNQPTSDDLEALIAIEDARKSFDEKLDTSFKPAISELQNLGYPGFTDPQIQIKGHLNPIEGLNHDSSVKFNVMKMDSTDDNIAYLPEKYNGLGYQNLISMVFTLIRFRDEWMRKGKASQNLEEKDFAIEPLHIVLIEEPEAHLHPQVQQVFINKAYDVLRNHDYLGNSNKYSTQMIVSTHSSHIAHELDFKDLRYFKRTTNENCKNLPCSEIVNLSYVFGYDTDKFVTRYLKLTHCDLFFADAAILVEGPTEKILIPDFIKSKVDNIKVYPTLDSKYITILEIGGSHAHRLKPLIETLGLITLVITDIDSKEPYLDQETKTKLRKIQPEKNRDYVTDNDTLKKWLPGKENLDELLVMDDSSKVSENSLVRVAFQYPFNIQNIEKWNNEEVIPYTFEDALVFSNISIFKELESPIGLLKKMVNSLSEDTIQGASKKMFDDLKKGKKAEMALELILLNDPLKVPKYINEGLEWLQNQLNAETENYFCADITGNEQ